MKGDRRKQFHARRLWPSGSRTSQVSVRELPVP